MFIRFQVFVLLLAMPLWAQTDPAASTHRAIEAPGSPSEQLQSKTNSGPSLAQIVEQTRMDCIQSRRIICGKILKVLPDGLVIDSGYTNLMRSPLNQSWLAPGTAQGERTTNIVEGNQPESVCIGLVFLTDLPKKPVARVYDYVNLVGYPTGQYTYTSVGDLRRTVRKFSTKLARSVQWRLDENEKQRAPSK